MPSPPFKIDRFNRRLIAISVGLFGVGTAAANGIALLVPSAAPGGRAPAPLLTFDALLGLGYLGAAWGIGLERRWSPHWVWGLAVLHALAATALAALIVTGAAVPGRALWAKLGREGFWVLIGLYLLKGG